MKVKSKLGVALVVVAVLCVGSLIQSSIIDRETGALDVNSSNVKRFRRSHQAEPAIRHTDETYEKVRLSQVAHLLNIKRVIPPARENTTKCVRDMDVETLTAAKNPMVYVGGLQVNFTEAVAANDGLNIVQMKVRTSSGIRHDVLADRVRLSSSTSLRFLDSNHFVGANFGLRTLSIYHFDLHYQTYRELSTISCTTFKNRSAEIDLIDYDGKSKIITSNLFEGTQTIYHVNVTEWTLSKYKDIDSFGTGGHVGGQRCHGVRFFPNSSTIIVATGVDEASGYKVIIYDSEKKRSLMNVVYDAQNPEWIGRPWHAQDMVFIDQSNVVILYTTSALQPRFEDISCQPMMEGVTYATRLVLYSLDLQHRTYFQKTFFDISDSHPDSIAYRSGYCYVSDQLNDLIYIIRIDIDGDGAMAIHGMMLDFSMPHGLDLFPNASIFGSSNYGDSSFKIMKLPEFI
eukprot:m.150981 g.150981  ORF g.150981 m.150981 type:complete len:457 (-) comp17841_c0_seq1:103-1473(-)